MTKKMDSLQHPPVPGLGLSFDYLPNVENRFPHAIPDCFTSQGVTLRERRMLEFVNQITDKPEWTRKIVDEDIVAKWKGEAVRWDAECCAGGDWWLSETMFDVCMCELREKAKFYQKTGIVVVLDTDATVVKSDLGVNSELSNKLKEVVKILEDVPDKMRDWHPGSHGQVLDLVHPSLYPIVHGLTRILPNENVPLKTCIELTGKGTELQEQTSVSINRHSGWDDDIEIPNAWSKYQWIPSQISFTDEGSARIDSYVNNLHPKRHADFYPILEQCVDAAIPLWNECLSCFHDRIRIPLELTSDNDFTFPEDTKFDREFYMNKFKESGRPLPDMSEVEENDDDEWADEWDCVDEWEDWKRANRILRHPEPEYKPQSEMRDRKGAKPVDLRKNVADKSIQVIFKLANIHLTPEDSDYKGGSWHIEGSLNEHICATALLYYDSENVTDSRLAFRYQFDNESMIMRPAQSEYDSCCQMYGVEMEGPAILHLGSVLTRQDRMLVFPNVLQHQVQPFSLADKTKPGHRKILAMFLVDPHIPILSTAHIPSQRRDWWADEVRNINPFDSLPEELFTMIMDAMGDFPISPQQAEEIREALMEVRRHVDDDIEQCLQQDTFNFCEH